MFLFFSCYVDTYRINAVKNNNLNNFLATNNLSDEDK
jgi:hypothetical protein